MSIENGNRSEERNSIPTPVEATEQNEVTEQALLGNVERLRENVERMREIPEEVATSPEGQRETTSFQSEVIDRVRGLKDSIIEKIAKLGEARVPDTFFKYVSGAGAALVIGPMLVQYARSQYPEVGAVLDAAPDALQQVIHFDAWAKIVNFLTGGANETIWKAGSAGVNNLLADISSGRVDMLSVTDDQMNMLQSNLGTSIDSIQRAANRGDIADVQRLAAINSWQGTTARGVFGNMPVLGIPAAAVYHLFDGITSAARRSVAKQK